ncbi:type VI secretion system lipoprotein TssJ [Paraburkholderia sp. NMBU_R16]|uniref:type VI secretion system lipoprotein TssJ n=1 Tax=Paraburkholderia sp. NMBU_R16 TaxID=2698676 RepID=UPI001564DDAF|nr:type VI secretion system lipoprotein TssJ [Paraburkholderia sp. NMBU_R16]NRO97434.1 type VI secretion system lipoprotein TssJ [Paraburkholderia sp. NMBU_R16]
MTHWQWPAGRILSACLVLLPGCAATEHLAAAPYSVTFDVAADVNRDTNRNPAPIVLKVFQLKTASAFEGADFFSLQSKPDAALGGELLSVERVILRPGESRTLRYVGNVEAHALGVVAEYRSLEQNRWKLTVALPQPKQLNFYRFWQTSPSEMKVTIAVRSGGLALGNDKRGGS